MLAIAGLGGMAGFGERFGVGERPRWGRKAVPSGVHTIDPTPPTSNPLPMPIVRLIAYALARCGRAGPAARLLTVSGAAPTPVEQDGLLGSPLRTVALRLQARLVATPDHPEIDVLAGRLLQALEQPHQLTTQERSRLLISLAAWFDRRPVLTASGRTTCTVHDGEGRELSRHEGLLPWSGTCRLPAGGFLRLGAGPALAALTWEGLRHDQPADVRRPVLERSLIDAESGKPVTTAQRGRRYLRRITATIAQPTRNLLLTDCLPAGLEADRDPDRQGARHPLVSHRELRHDRALFVCTGPVCGRVEVTWPVLAVTPGLYRPRPAQIEALYLPGSSSWICGEEPLEVVDGARAP